MAKIIMHVDLNAFFATAEVIRNPEYKGKSLVVGGFSKRGIVSTASYEARAKGIKSAMPIYMARQLDPNVIIVPVDFEYYERLSHQFVTFLRGYSSKVEVASIDECFVDMSEAMKNVTNPISYLKDLQNKLYEQTKLLCSIGVAPTKFLAKMASNMKKPRGITIIRRRDIKKKLWPLKIEEMFGVGVKTAPVLKKLNINTIGDLANTNDPRVKERLGKFYDTIYAWVHGQGNDEVVSEADDPKSISASRTFYDDTSDYKQIEAMFRTLSLEVSERAQEQEKKGVTLQITIRKSNFKTTTHAKTYDEPFNSFSLIFGRAMMLFDQNYDGEAIRLVGVALQNIDKVVIRNVQLSLFDVEEPVEQSATIRLIDEFNSKFDKKVFKRLSDVKKEKK